MASRSRAFLRPFSLVFLLAGMVASAQGPAQAKQSPPEVKELQAAMGMPDPVAKLKALERIQAAYPASALRPILEFQIVAAQVALAGTLEVVLALQKPGLETALGALRISLPSTAARQIMDHPKLASFDPVKVLDAVQRYRELCRKAQADPAAVMAADERERDWLRTLVVDFDLLVAKAQVRAGEPAKALVSLEDYVKGQGPANAAYHLARGDAYEAMGRPQEAYEALLSAALENNRDGLRRAKAAYVKLHGKEDGFDAILDAKTKELPFHPAPFKPGPEWKGKAVLVELFTGSECPPCVAADFAFDGLMEAYPATTLVVLEYHLPIPAPDPMMNPASKQRQDYYGVNSTPTVMIEGQEKLTGGGSRSMAAQKYQQLTAKLSERSGAAPGASLKVQASRTADRVEVSFDLGQAIAGIDYHLALVQGQQEHKGGNHILVHKMVVRDLTTLDRTVTKAAFDLAASEQITDAYLTAFEQTSTRFKGFHFPVRRHTISRQGLKVVLFAQERATKKVLQAIVTDVK